MPVRTLCHPRPLIGKFSEQRKRNKTRLTADSNPGSQFFVVRLPSPKTFRSMPKTQTLDIHNLAVPEMTPIHTPGHSVLRPHNPDRSTDEHAHQQIRKHVRMEHDAERLPSICILEYDRYEGGA